MQSLELQLLIAAPEVARAEGNTTYRLVRVVTEDGREEVHVSGRRASLLPVPRPGPKERPTPHRVRFNSKADSPAALGPEGDSAIRGP